MSSGIAFAGNSAISGRPDARSLRPFFIETRQVDPDDTGRKPEVREDRSKICRQSVSIALTLTLLVQVAFLPEAHGVSLTLLGKRTEEELPLQLVKGGEYRSRLEHLSPDQIQLLEKLNRCESGVLKGLRTLVVPIRWDIDEISLSPLPLAYAWARRHAKALVVHLPYQVFGAYEEGRLIRWGPVSSGRKEHPTPNGLFHLNWKDRYRISSVDPDWHLPWYFNFHNDRGLSFHAYYLPGYPASHACLRLLDRDARRLFYWGEEWKLGPRGWEILDRGTPVLILGQYDFSSPGPWKDPRRLKDRINLPELSAPEPSRRTGSPAEPGGLSFWSRERD